MEKNQTIKASEIRIQNILQHKDNIITVKGISPHCNDYAINTDSEWVYLKNCSPIPLTEEWLLRMGAKRNRDGWYLSADYMLYNPLTHLDVRSSEYYALMYNDKIITTRPIQYIHQLQNLYYSLTNQELEIKES